MTGRVYLDWNATAPLRMEARAAMLAAMDAVGNPSSVHAEGRAAKAIVEKARAQIATAFGAEGADIVFTSGATEAAALALAGRDLAGAAVEHDAVMGWIKPTLAVSRSGAVTVDDPAKTTLQAANSETGVVQDLPAGLAVCDATQIWGKLPVAFNWMGCDMALASAHKLGGPKGVGALIFRQGFDVAAQIRGGGQEMGRRSGTENVVGIAGFGAAAAAAARDLEEGLAARQEKLRNILESAIEAAGSGIIFLGHATKRLPNTSCFSVPGWKGETQVMQMDLAGIAISAGSACSSGKAKPSRVVEAMGYGADVAAGAIRVSLGADTTEEDIGRFVDAWSKSYAKRKARAA
ncbi:MAG: cysteine desulfurase family protein [Pseudomonadota bacterium]